MEPKYHSELERRLATYLRGRGFPPDSIVHEPVLAPIDSRRSYRPDFAIVDPERRDWLAVIEVKGAVMHTPRESVGEQLRAYASALGKRSLPLFLVTPGRDGSSFDVARVDDATGVLVDLGPDQFPTYEALRAATQASQKDVAVTGVRDTTDALRTRCHLVAVLAFALVCVDAYLKETRKITLLTPERLALLGIAAALLLIPYAAKLKAFGLEFERAADKPKGVDPPGSDLTRR